MIFRQNKSEKLVREYIFHVLRDVKDRRSITETGYDNSYDDGSADSLGRRYAWGNTDDLYQAFIQPFVDIVGTAMGRTKEVIRSGITALNVAFESLATSLVPFLSDSYDDIFKQEKIDIANIRSQYQHYYDATDEALKGDAKILAFMAFPGAALTGKFMLTAPKVAQSILSVASGGYADDHLGKSPRGTGSSPSDVFDSYARAYNTLLIEAEKNTKQKKSTLSSKVKSKMFIDKIIDKSPAMKDSERLAKEIHRRTLGERLKLILDIYDAKTLEELKKVIKSTLKMPKASEIDPEQKVSAQEVENKFLEAAKSTSQKAAIDALKKHVMPVRLAFGDDHPFVKDYDAAINAISSGDANQIKTIKKEFDLNKI